MCGNQVFSIFPNNSRSKQNKNNPKHPFVGIGKWETCAKFQRKISNSRVVGVRQRFQILKQNIRHLYQILSTQATLMVNVVVKW